MKKTFTLLLAVALAFFLNASALAQQIESEASTSSQDGYDDIPDFGGPESVSGQLKHADELRDAMYEWPFFDGYFDWKRQINDDYGVSFGLHFYGL